MSENRGIFSLEEFYNLQVSGETTNILDAFRYVNSLATTGGPSYGYWAGGAASQTVTRLDFLNDTAAQAPKGPLNQTAYSFGGTASTSYAYFYGGQMAGSRIQRIDFADDTATASPKGPLSAAAGYQGTVGNDSYGYSVAGGGSVPTNSNVDRLDYANDTSTASPKGKASLARSGVLGGAGNNDYGYIGGGVVQPGTNTKTTVDRIDYANDTATMAVKGPLNAARYYMGAAGNSSYGYFGCGNSGPSKTDRLDYSSDTTQTSQKAALTQAKGFYGSTGSNAYGYYGGGGPAGPGSRVDRIDYSNDTAVANSMSNLPSSLMKLTAAAAQDNGQPAPQGIVPATRSEASGTGSYAYGYWIGGNGGGSQYNRVDFSNDTGTAGVRGNLDRSVDRNVAVSSMNYAYVAGGFSNTNISRIDYADDTATATPKGNLLPISGLSSPAGVDTINYGYICGGLSYTRVDRIDYSNDTAVASARGPLTATRRYISAAGNSSYGYVAGGTPAPGYMSSVDRIDYADDTATATPKGPLPYVLLGYGMTGNADYGYVNGGFNAVPGSNNWISSVNRIDYANDTATAAPKGPLTQARRTKSTGSTSYGWSGGGSTNGHAGTSTIDRIDYANDTATASARGSLSGTRTNHYAASAQANAKPQLNPAAPKALQTVDKGADGYTVAGALGPAYGYVMAGFPPTPNNTSVDRIDFSNDTATASPRGFILLETRNFNSVEVTSVTHGYIGGGQHPQTSSVDRIDYANDTATASPVGKLPTTNRGASGASNSSYGWIGGGNDGSNYISTVSRIDFSNDNATTSVRGPLSTTQRGAAATGNSNYGYYAGGYTPSQVSTVSRVDYSNDTATASVKGPLNETKYEFAAVGNADYGYWAGGQYRSSTQERIDYANDTATATPKGTLPIKISENWGTGDQSYGFYTGGNSQEYHGAPVVSSVYRVEFSNDTITTKGPLSTDRRYHSATGARKNALQGSPTFIPRIRWVDSVAETPSVSAGPAYGYWGGGYNPAHVSTVSRLDFSSDSTATTPKGNLSAARHTLAATGNSTHGYFGGGTPSSIVDRIDYGNDTATASPKGPLSLARGQFAATGNSNFGYFAGGTPGGPYSTVDRIDYSNDSATASTKGPLANGIYYQTATGNSNFGYFAGGGTGSPANTWVQRVDYSNDTATASLKGNLYTKTRRSQASGNSNFGYVSGGDADNANAPILTMVQRIDYSNDTATAVQKGDLDYGKFSAGGTGSDSFGYSGGGRIWPAIISLMSRIDYSNDTATATAKGNLTNSIHSMGAVSARENALLNSPTAAILAPVQPPFPFPVQLYNPATNQGYGYAAGGPTTPGGSSNTTIVQRIEYANDTATAAVKGSLSLDRKNHSASGNINYGYNAGGHINPGFTATSSTDRIDYASDTSTATPKGTLTFSAAVRQSTSNTSYGWFGGGNPSPYTSKIDRLDFSNDTATASPRGPLSSAKTSMGSAGNASYGYFAGGTEGPSGLSTVNRIDYSSDTGTTPTKGPLSSARESLVAFGNSSYGYFGGDYPGSITTIDRIDYSNDTATASVKGPLDEGKRNSGGVASASGYGYAMGGQPSSSPSTSSISRVEFANDTATASPKGNLYINTTGFGAVSAGDNGL